MRGRVWRCANVRRTAGLHRLLIAFLIFEEAFLEGFEVLALLGEFLPLALDFDFLLFGLFAGLADDGIARRLEFGLTGGEGGEGGGQSGLAFGGGLAELLFAFGMLGGELLAFGGQFGFAFGELAGLFGGAFLHAAFEFRALFFERFPEAVEILRAGQLEALKFRLRLAEALPFGLQFGQLLAQVDLFLFGSQVFLLQGIAAFLKLLALLAQLAEVLLLILAEFFLALVQIVLEFLAPGFPLLLLLTELFLRLGEPQLGADFDFLLGLIDLATALADFGVAGFQTEALNFEFALLFADALGPLGLHSGKLGALFFEKAPLVLDEESFLFDGLLCLEPLGLDLQHEPALFQFALTFVERGRGRAGPQASGC